MTRVWNNGAVLPTGKDRIGGRPVPLLLANFALSEAYRTQETDQKNHIFWLENFKENCHLKTYE